jgi:hypothetical protein
MSIFGRHYTDKIMHLQTQTGELVKICLVYKSCVTLSNNKLKKNAKEDNNYLFICRRSDEKNLLSHKESFNAK